MNIYKLNKIVLTLVLMFNTIIISYANVTKSGAWNDVNTWSEGVIPKTSSTSSYTDLSFASSGLILTVNSTQYADIVNLGSTQDSIISISKGATFNLTGNTVAGKDYFLTSSSAASKINFIGDGTFNIVGTKTFEFQPADITFDTKVTYSGPYYNALNLQMSATPGKMTFNKDVSIWGQVQLSNWIVNVGENLTCNTSFLISSGTGGSVTIGKGTKWTSSSSVMMRNLVLNGTLKATTSRDYKQERFAFSLIKTVIGSSGSFISAATDKNSRGIISETFVSNAAANAISIAGTMFFNNYSSFTLNTSNAINTQGQGSQADSSFYIVNYSCQNVSGVYTDTFGFAKVGGVLNADNDFGSFIFYEGSILNLQTNGHNSVVKNFLSYTDGMSFTVNLSNHEDFTMKLMSLGDIEIYDDGGRVRAYNIKVEDADGFLDNAYITADIGGGYWVNATGAIPEPSTCAAIFAVVALAVLAYRKNK